MNLSLSLQSLAKQKKVFLFTKEHFELFYDVLEVFDVLVYQNISADSIDNLSSELSLLKIDLIIIELEDNYENIYKSIQVYKQEKKSLTIMTILNHGAYKDLPVNISNSIVTSLISRDELKIKLFELLRDMQNSSSIQAIQDTYENSELFEVIYITEKLDEISASLDSGDISEDVFLNLLESISNIEIFLNNYLISSKKIKPILSNLREFVSFIDIHCVNIESLDGFEYLSRIVEDISIFLKKYFIYKEFNDIYIVEDSLEVSLSFMKQKFYSLESEDNSKMEFF